MAVQKGLGMLLQMGGQKYDEKKGLDVFIMDRFRASKMAGSQMFAEAMDYKVAFEMERPTKATSLHVELMDQMLMLYIYTYHKFLNDPGIGSYVRRLADYTIKERQRANADGAARYGEHYVEPDVPKWLNLQKIGYRASETAPGIFTGELSSRLKRFIKFDRGNELKAGVYWDDDAGPLRNGLYPSELSTMIEFGSGKIPARPIILRIAGSKFFRENYKKLLEIYKKQTHTRSEPRVARALRYKISGD